MSGKSKTRNSLHHLADIGAAERLPLSSTSQLFPLHQTKDSRLNRSNELFN